MSYDEKLAERVRTTLAETSGIAEKKMFGGIAFMLHDRMFCGIIKEDLVVRVGPQQYEAALRQPHVRPMDFTGRPMSGYVYVEASGCRGKSALKKWIQWGTAFVSTMPAKKPRKAQTKRQT